MPGEFFAALKDLCATPLTSEAMPRNEILEAAETPTDQAVLVENQAKKGTDELVSLIKMPWTRNPVLTKGGNVNLYSQVNCEAYLAQGCGVPSPTPCFHCKKGGGPFSVCIVVPGYLNGSCAGCHYNGNGGRCSLGSSKLAPNPIAPKIYK